MSAELSTSRLRLKALTAAQLELYLNNPTELEAELGFSISRRVVDANVTRAINMKLAKMAEADIRLHNWFTYWLIIIRTEAAGVGLIGFKGHPDINGKTEIGYGIDAAYRNKGYMTEAVKALTHWAFANNACRALTAQTVSNPASEKVLQKSGWQKVRQGDKYSDWEILR